MLTYLARRLVLAAITIFAITLVTFGILHLPPVDFVTAYAAQAATQGTLISAAEADAMRLAYGLNQPLWVQYWKWIAMVAQRRFWPLVRVRPPGYRGHRRPTVAHHAAVTRRHRRHLGPRFADRHLLRRAPVLAGRLRLHLPGLHRPCHPELPAGADRHVFRPAAVRHQRRRPVLRRAAAGALELDEGGGPDPAPAGADPDPVAGRHRAARADHARQPA